MKIALWIAGIVGVYLALGIGMSVLLYQTPYRDNGAIVITLLWPLFLWGILRG